MRQLTAKQKKYIDKLIAERDIYNWEDFTLEEQETLEEMNDTEVLWMNAQRYAHDKTMDKAFPKYKVKGSSW